MLVSIDHALAGAQIFRPWRLIGEVCVDVTLQQGKIPETIHHSMCVVHRIPFRAAVRIGIRMCGQAEGHGRAGARPSRCGQAVRCRWNDRRPVSESHRT